MRAAEDVQRQIAIAIVVAVKEPPLLMPVQRIVGGIEIEDDLLWRMLVRLRLRGSLRRGGVQRTAGRERGRRDARPGTPQTRHFVKFSDSAVYRLGRRKLPITRE